MDKHWPMQTQLDSKSKSEICVSSKLFVFHIKLANYQKHSVGVGARQQKF